MSAKISIRVQLLQPSKRTMKKNLDFLCPFELHISPNQLKYVTKTVCFVFRLSYYLVYFCTPKNNKNFGMTPEKFPYFQVHSGIVLNFRRYIQPWLIEWFVFVTPVFTKLSDFFRGQVLCPGFSYNCFLDLTNFFQWFLTFE